MTNYVDEMHDIAETLRFVAFDVRILADSFYGTGNTYASGRLDRVADKLEEQAKRVSDSCGDRVSSDLHQAQQGTANMIHAAIAIATRVEAERCFGGRNERHAEALEEDR